jgi:hypothetical protein
MTFLLTNKGIEHNVRERESISVFDKFVKAMLVSNFYRSFCSFFLVLLAFGTSIIQIFIE